MKNYFTRFCLLLLGLALTTASLSAQLVHSPTSAHTSYDNISMTGYQGWFGTPGDGGTNGWRHYSRGGEFRPGQASIEYWPDMREAEEDERYPTEFVFDDGTPATVFSSVNPKTVDRHFQWMKEYGIDGAFVQRFRSDFGIQDVLTQVMSNALEGADNHGRAISVMYDISGTNIYVNGSDPTSVNTTRAAIVDQIFNDWAMLVDDLQLTTRGDEQSYLYHNGKPLVALWGFGFPSRFGPDGVDIQFFVDLVDRFQNDPVYGGCSIMLGVPTRWRTGGGDALSGSQHTEMLNLIRQVDVVMPWHTSRFGRSQMYGEFQNTVAGDVAWCATEGLTYTPTISPGIREKILNMNDYERPREGGLYFWDMARAAVLAGSENFYLGMFDEVDEGTQYFKIANNPPFYGIDPDFTDYGNNPEDHYLWLAGEATRGLRGEFTMETTFRERAGAEDFQADIEVEDDGEAYDIELAAPVPGRKIFFADPYTVPDGAPTVGVPRDSALFPNELTTEPTTFPTGARGRYLRFIEVEEATGAVIAYRAFVAVHGFASVPYTTSFEGEEVDPQFWTTATENSTGTMATSADYEPNTGNRHLISSTDEAGAASVNTADLHLSLADINTDVILRYAVKTLGSPTAPEDGVYFSADNGANFTQVANFEDATNNYTEVVLNVNELTGAAGLSFTDKFVVRLRHRATGLNETGGLAVDDFSVQFSTDRSGFARFIGRDDLTQGEWQGVYGVDGQLIVGKEANLPDYATVVWSEETFEVVFEDESTDPRGLRYTEDFTVLAGRTAATEDHPWRFTIDVGERESSVYMYFLDADEADRQFIINATDAATGDRYDVQTVSDFSGGKWIGWELSGRVTFITDLLAGPGAVVSGIFFAPSAPEEIEVETYLTFDGGDDYVDAGRDPAVQVSGSAITLEGWFKADSTRTETYQSTVLAMDHSEPGNDLGYFLRANGDGRVQWGFGDGTWHEVESDPTVQLFEPGTWNHVAGTYDGAIQKIYLNGNLIAVSEPFTATVGVAPTESLYLGASPAFADRSVGGGLAEIRIWAVARTDSEIKEFATQRITGGESGLAAYWPIDEGEGQTILDDSPNGLFAVRGGTTEEEDTDPIWTEGVVVPDLVNILEGFNPSFEDDLEFWRFFEVPNGLGSTAEIITGDVIDGAKAARVTFTEASEDLVDRALDNWDSNMPLVPDTTYTVSFWAKSDDFNNGVLRVVHGYFDADRNVVGEGTVAFTLTDTYAEYTFTFTPPAQTEKGWIGFRWKDAEDTEFRAGIVVIDHIQVLKPETPNSVSGPYAVLRDGTILEPNYPNPFAARTTIGFRLPRPTPVQLTIHDATGRRVATVLDQDMAAGTHTVDWAAAGLPRGAYHLILRTNTAVLSRRLIVAGK